MKKIIFIIMILPSFLFANIKLNECKKCHGENFQDTTMKGMIPVKGQSKEQIFKKLLNYKNGIKVNTNEGTQVMKHIISKYNEEDIKYISDIISKLK